MLYSSTLLLFVKGDFQPEAGWLLCEVFPEERVPFQNDILAIFGLSPPNKDIVLLGEDGNGTSDFASINLEGNRS